MTDETAVTVREQEIAPVPPMRAIIAPPGNFQAYMQKLWVQANERVVEAEQLVEQRTRERDETEALYNRHYNDASPDDDAQQYLLVRGQLQGRRSQLTRALTGLRNAENFRDALGAGYVPLPRMPAVNLRWVQEIMPADVLDAMQEAKQAGMFEEFRIVTGEETTGGGWPRGRALKGRDPILVGLVGDEMFAVAWWR
jgi:hypothetical protein